MRVPEEFAALRAASILILGETDARGSGHELFLCFRKEKFRVIKERLRKEDHRMMRVLQELDPSFLRPEIPATRSQSSESSSSEQEGVTFRDILLHDKKVSRARHG